MGYKNVLSSSQQHLNPQKFTKKFSKFKMVQLIYLSMQKKFNLIPVLLKHLQNPFSKVEWYFINWLFQYFLSAIKLGKSVSPTIDTSRLIKPVNRISPSSDVGSISGSTISSQISGTATTSIKSISPSSLPKLKEPRPNASEVIQGPPQTSTSEVTENGTRRFRCDICDIGFRFQVKIYNVKTL